MYYLLFVAIGIERLIELIVSKPNAQWAFAHGGKEFGHGHYRVMVIAHVVCLTAALFTMANALLLTVRIRLENAALGYT